MKTAQQFYLISTEGLTDAQINFLAACEEIFFEKPQIDDNIYFLRMALDKIGFVQGCPEAADIIAAWDYFKFLPKPVLRNSLKKPVKLSSIFKKVADPQTGYLHNLYGSNYNQVIAGYLKIDEKIEVFGYGSDIYYKLVRDNTRLYIEHNSIISSRFIAVIENDIF